jgi:dihydroorotate dehydrogenase electron transfer subunit
MRQFDARVLSNDAYGPACRKIRVEVPERLVRYDPGQFFHIRCGRGTDPLLRRPFSVYAVDADPDGWVRRLDFLFTVVGHGTRALAAHGPGDALNLLGPLGRGFAPPPEPAWHVMVAGGVGIAPFYDLAIHLMARGRTSTAGGGKGTGDGGRGTGEKPQITLLFGARTRQDLYGLSDLETLGIEIRTATDDGSHGTKGYVTELLEALLDRKSVFPTPNPKPGTPYPLQVYGCGPPPMLDRVTAIVQARGVPCQLSLDRRMGCGVGACGACVCKVKTDDADGWNYIRICRMGPVVDAARLVL